jgi:RNA-directed DNA polymerase
VVPPSEGNEVTRDGRPGFGASHSTVEAGEFDPSGDPVEERGCRSMEPLKGQTAETSGSSTVLTKQQRIADLAWRSPQMAITTLAHHIDLDWLREAYRRTRKDGATGVDGQTAQAYAADLEANLRSLLERAKSGRYKAPPVRRVYIPKGDGPKTRPIGIPTFEDKVLQRAVVMVLEAVYEQDFLDGSYGFRPGRSAHQALEVLWRRLMNTRVSWVLEVDIQQFFDHLDHSQLRRILRQRVRDGVLLRLIGKWLKAGALESGRLVRPESGSPQGGVISPLLANVYLHEVLDTWFEQTVKPRMRGHASLIRFADDAVIVFEEESDARRVLAVLPKRFAKYGLTLHPEKTRLVPFRRPPREVVSGIPRAHRPGTFDFLGFTHYWGTTRKGRWAVQRKTASKRFSRALRTLAEWCRRYRHLPIREQWQALGLKLQGHYAYYGIPGNARCLGRFRHFAERVWQKWLSRRSHRARISWERFAGLQARYPLPAIRVLRPPRVT